MGKTIVVANVRNKNGAAMTKAEVITELVKASLVSNYRYADRAVEIYNTLVKDGVYVEEEREI